MSPSSTQTGLLPLTAESSTGLSAQDQASAASNDGDGPLAIEATKLDDCINALVAKDQQNPGGTQGIAVIGNSMGMAITRGWLVLAQQRHSASLSAVSTVVSLEGANQGSIIALAGQGLNSALDETSCLPGPLASVASAVIPLLAQAEGDIGGINARRPGVQDLAPGSA